MRRRRFALLLAPLLAGCSRQSATKESLLPASIGTEWKLRSLAELPAPDAPDPLPKNQIKRKVQGAYQGPGAVEVDLYELPSSALGLDMAQRWKPLPNTVVFYQDEYFVVVRWVDVDRAKLGAFIRALESHLKQAGK